MEHLIQHTMIRRSRLLDEFIHSNQWIAIEQLADKLNCSHQTILSDCDFFEKEWGDCVTIELSKKLGARLSMNKNHSINELYKKLLQSSGDLALLESVFFYPNETKDFHTKRLFISESSLYRSFKRLKQVLKDRNMDVIYIDDVYRITAKDELQLRWFFTLYFCETYGENEWPFPLEQKNIQKYIKISLNPNSFVKSMSTLRFLSYSIAISIIRETQKFFISTDIIQQKNMKLNEEKKESMIAFLDKNYVGLDADKLYYSVYWWKYRWSYSKEYYLTRKSGETFIKKLCTELNIAISDADKNTLIDWMQFVYVRRKLYPFPEYILHNRYIYTSIVIKRVYPNFSKMVNDLLYIMEERSGFPWNSLYYAELLSEVFLNWSMLYKNLDDKKQSILTVYIVSNLGENHAAFISYLIKNRFPDKILTYYDKADEDSEVAMKISDCDLCLSNYPLGEEYSDDLIIIEDIPSQKDWLDISYNVNKKMQLKINHKLQRYLSKRDLA